MTVLQTGAGALILLANSFDEFYTRWLEELADTESYRRKIEGIKEMRRQNGIDTP